MSNEVYFLSSLIFLKTFLIKKSIKEIAKQVRLLRQREEKLNRDLMQAQSNYTTTQSRYKSSRKEELYKKKGERWIASWNCLPSALMAPYQDSKDWILTD